MKREDILSALLQTAADLPWAVALWEGGSASFGRADEWSDVDLGLAVLPGHVAEGFSVMEAALTALSPIAAIWEACPTTDLKPQRFYRLEASGPWLLVDLCVFPTTTPPFERFVDRRRHGEPRVFFDRGEYTADPPMDTTIWREKLRHRLHWLRGRVELLYGLPLKSLYRGELAEAVGFYQGMVLRPLVEILRMRHDPYRYDFDVRYLRYDIPEPARSALYALWFVADPDDLVIKHSRALSWFREEALAIDIDRLDLD